MAKSTGISAAKPRSIVAKVNENFEGTNEYDGKKKQKIFNQYQINV